MDQKCGFGGFWCHLGARCGAQGVVVLTGAQMKEVLDPIRRFLTKFDVILGSLLDVIFEDFHTVGVSGA